MRKLASIRRIADIQPIPDADAIEVATVDGWKVVVKKGEFKVGDLAIYFEIDSWVPHALAPFLTKNAAIPRQYNGVEGERLKTVKLRGQLSQGLLLPLNIMAGVDKKVSYEPGGYVKYGDHESVRLWEEDTDLTDILDVQKWEAPIPAQMQGQAKGTFPTQYAPKTDQERIQNLWRKVDQRRDELYEISVKLDGSSCTVFVIDGEVRVASRNMELKINEENMGNAYVQMAVEAGQKLLDAGKDNVAVQGELMGPGIQGNRENFKEVRFFVFDVVDCTTREKILPDDRAKFVTECNLEHVPLLGTYREFPYATLDEALEEVSKMKSINHKIAEGIVFKSCVDPEWSFKIISNRFLLKGGN